MQHERDKLHKSFEDNAHLNSEKHNFIENFEKEIRNLQDSLEQSNDQLKAVEIDRDTLQQRMQVNTSQVN